MAAGLVGRGSVCVSGVVRACVVQRAVEVCEAAVTAASKVCVHVWPALVPRLMQRMRWLHGCIIMRLQGSASWLHAEALAAQRLFSAVAAAAAASLSTMVRLSHLSGRLAGEGWLGGSGNGWALWGVLGVPRALR